MGRWVTPPLISVVLATANAALLQTEAPTWRDAVAARRRFELSAVLRPKELPTPPAPTD